MVDLAESEEKFTIRIRTGTIWIDRRKCEVCETYECAKACSLYGRNIIRIKNGVPTTFLSDEEVKRRDNECLACEIHCPHQAVKIILDFPELSELGSFGRD